jgi:hypothetical protein
MSFASIWCFTLRLPWQLGAAFFFQHLLDACPASNTLGWRWVVGLQTPGKTYLARADLIRDLSGGRFRVAAPLAREAAPWPADTIPPPIPPVPAMRADPMLRTGLFITTEDCSLDQLALPPLVALAATPDIGGTPAPLKHRVAMAMLGDGLTRAASRFGLEPERVDATFGVEAMRAWAARHRLHQIITADAPLGPVKERLDMLAPALAADGVALVQVLSNRLIAMQAVAVKAGENTVELPVTDDWGTGVYVTASALRGMDSAAGRNPARALGVAHASIDPAQRALAASIETASEATPRGPLDVAVKVDGVAAGETAYVTVAAVDQGILNLTGFTPPDPMDHYFGQRKLGIGVRDIYGRLIDGINGAVGQVRSGGDAGAGARLQAPPPTEELVAYFTGPLTVDADGMARTRFDLPSFNGTIKVMAVALRLKFL